jgi:hypothetical protein
LYDFQSANPNYQRLQALFAPSSQIIHARLKYWLYSQSGVDFSPGQYAITGKIQGIFAKSSKATRAILRKYALNQALSAQLPVQWNSEFAR